MSDILIEADLLATTNLKNLFNTSTGNPVEQRAQLRSSQNATAQITTTNLRNLINNGTTSSQADEQKTDTGSELEITDWGKELKERLDTNHALSDDARVPDLVIEKQFWQDFFRSNFKDETVRKQLSLIGRLLTEDLKTLGFTSNKNLIYAFLKQDYVQKQLLIPGLLNQTTYKAIHNAVAKKLVADNEFLKDNNYNIIYCINWYRNIAPKDMETYLKVQKKILHTNVSVYNDDIQVKNIKTLTRLDENGEGPDSIKEAELKTLSELQASLGLDDEPDEISTTSTEAMSISKLMEKIKTPEDAKAALTFVAYTSNDEAVFNKAVEIIRTRFKDVRSQAEVLKPTSLLGSALRKAKLTTNKQKLNDFLAEIANRDFN